MSENYRFAIRSALLASAGFVSLISGAAYAQTAPANTNAPKADGIGDIVVTAQRRSEKAQNVPIAITSLSSKTLAAGGVISTVDLPQLTPGLNFNTNLGGFGQPRIRGIGTSATGPGIENPVATYVDGVYYGSATGAIFELSDVQQVDVLKGPQGTLFGRNATGGVIQVTTKDPTQDLHADFKVGYGNYNTWGGSGYISGGLAPTLTASIAAQFNEQDTGYGTNLYNGQQVQKGWDYALRGKLVWRPDSATKVTLSGDYGILKRSDPAIRTYQGLTINGTTTPGGPYDIDLNTQPLVHTRQAGAVLNIQHDFTGVQLVSISAYRNSQLFTSIDADQAPPIPHNPENLLNFSEIQNDEQFSQEVQLLSTNKGPLKWVIGGYYLWSQGKYDPITVQGILACGYKCANDTVVGQVNQTLNSYAAFAQTSYALGSATNLTAGLRYTSDNRKLDESQTNTVVPFFGPNTVTSFAANGSRTFPKLTWRLAVDHRFSPELMVYASYNRGFKSGSFQPDSFVQNLCVNSSATLTTCTGTGQVLQPETVDAFESGFKADLLDRKLRLNVSAFYYDYTNLQANQIIQGQLYVYNAPGSINYGLDADLVAKVAPDFTITAGASWLHARYKSGFNTPFWSVPAPNAYSLANPFFQLHGGNNVIQCSPSGNPPIFAPCDASGYHLQNTPDYTFNIGFNYDIHSDIGKFSLTGNYYYNGGYFDDPQNRLKQNAYGLLDASVTWASDKDRYFIRVWGKNLTDQFHTEQQNALDVGDNRVASPPRTYGVTLGVHY